MIKMTITFLVRTDKNSNKQNETHVFSFVTAVNWNFKKCRQLSQNTFFDIKF